MAAPARTPLIVLAGVEKTYQLARYGMTADAWLIRRQPGGTACGSSGQDAAADASSWLPALSS
ncbi:MAG TPA: hypothetical protein VG253_02780 [Streptosporangiaceae bacterium]|nr:hypothetical protein [Streptosporangiaceae bacterium]